MLLYRKGAATPIRVAFAEELALGCERFPETADIAPAATAANEPLEAAHAARVAKEKPLRLARVGRRFAEFDVETVVRDVYGACKRADGNRVGPIVKVVFPKGLAVVVAPSGKAQLDAVDALERRINGATDAKLAPLKADFAARLGAAASAFASAETAYRDAYKAWSDAFDEERLRRDDHYRTMDKLFGLIRAAFPTDAARREVVVPEGPNGKRSKKGDDDETETPTAPSDNA